MPRSRSRGSAARHRFAARSAARPARTPTATGCWRRWRASDVDCTACVRVAGCATPLSAIFIDARGDRMITTYRDDRIAAATPPEPTGLVATADAVLADNRFPDFVRPICTAARERGLTVVLDADKPTDLDRSAAADRHACDLLGRVRCARPPRPTISPPGCFASAKPTDALPRRHRRPAGRALARRHGAAPQPGLPGQGGGYARRRRRFSWRFRAGARGRSRCVGRHAFRFGGGRRSNARGSAVRPAPRPAPRSRPSWRHERPRTLRNSPRPRGRIALAGEFHSRYTMIADEIRRISLAMLPFAR